MKAMQVGWVTDPHLNFVRPPGRSAFYAELRDRRLDALLVGGDIGEADSVTPLLAEMEDALRLPIYFVLGNHDFYRDKIGEVRSRVASQAEASRWLHWLPAAGVVLLTDDTALVGHDGWADGRVGDFMRSDVMLNDYILIHDLRTKDKQERFRKLNILGDEAADFLDLRVREAISVRNRIV